MSYVHQGIIRENGRVEAIPVPAGSPELTLLPEDDAFHLTDPAIGDFEWWYFDVNDEESELFLKIVFHVGTDPLKTKVFPQLAVSLITPEGNLEMLTPFTFQSTGYSTEKCLVTAGNEVHIEALTPDRYSVRIDTATFRCNLIFDRIVEAWRPLGRDVNFNQGRRKGAFAWTIPMPLARVSGEAVWLDRIFHLDSPDGYHDHNYLRIDRRHPLHLDNLVSKWYWGKGQAGPYTIIFMDTRCRPHPVKSLMITKNKRIIHSSNNRVRCIVPEEKMDGQLRARYPSRIVLELSGNDPAFHIEFRFVSILDKRDLLTGVPRLLRWLIHRLVARPVYFGLKAELNLKIEGENYRGTGNYEMMLFRGP